MTIFTHNYDIIKIILLISPRGNDIFEEKYMGEEITCTRGQIHYQNIHIKQNRRNPNNVV